MTRRLSLVPEATSDDREQRSRRILVTPRRLAPFVLGELLAAQLAGRQCTLEHLCRVLPVRRADIRSTLSALHANDLYDVTRGRLTLRGFAVASAVGHSSASQLRKALHHEGPEGKLESLPPPSGTRLASVG